ncbi:MAG TPA: bacillithiol biosynthesis BshC, partial [Chitinophagales bacterium]|nr:bacillithiol biosynthesis BshC [Chitinophagales bacterium]
MQSHFYPLAETRFFNQTVQRYYSGDAALKPFYAFPPSLDAVHQAVQAKSQQPTDRNALVEALSKQYEQLRATKHYDVVLQNVESLKQPNTFTVTAAHQPHLLLGPLYVTYKIISVIRLAEQCKQRYPDYHFVPTFWLGSEDHDLDELGNVTVFDKTIALNDIEYKGPFGRMPIEKLNVVRDELYTVLGTSDQANKITQLLNKHYFSQPTVAAATRGLVHELFGQYGVVVVDGDDATLKENLVPAMLGEVSEQTGFKNVSNSIKALEQVGLSEQAHPR